MLAALLLPLAGFVLLFTTGERLRKVAGLLNSLLVAIALAVSVLFFGKIWLAEGVNALPPLSVEWFRIGNQAFNFQVNLDATATIMLVVVNLVALLVSIFSLSYMRSEPAISRYFAYLGLFTFSMNGLLLTGSLVVIYFFWELVGLSSYLLIGFWQEKPAAVKAAKKAFLLNRIGDAGFLVAIIALYQLTGSTELHIIREKISLVELDSAYPVLMLSGVGLLLAAAGKSAQLPFSPWLPDAMEGPTPVSALIHAATMVAAGVYLLARTQFIFLPEISGLVAWVGSITAFTAAFAALSQTDIKKVLAYSTISQLGYMVTGVGVGASEAALFHLVTHAFFKACLFLSAGAVIHSLHEAGHASGRHFDAQDMRLMGGLRKKLPVVTVAFTASAMALAGLPLLSGFLSKDAILVGAVNYALHQQNPVLFAIPALGLVTALLTAFYAGRQLLMVFWGKLRLAEIFPGVAEKIRPTSLAMNLPLLVLSALSLAFAFSLNPFSAGESWFMRQLQIGSPDVGPNAILVEIVSAFVAITGLSVAWLVYGAKKLAWFRKAWGSPDNGLYALSRNFWYFDWLYETALKKLVPGMASLAYRADSEVIDRLVNWLGMGNVVLAHLLANFDKLVVDGLVNSFSRLLAGIGRFTDSLQQARPQTYIALSVAGFLIFVYFVLF